MSLQPQTPTKLPFSFYLQVLLCAVLWGSAFPVIKNSYGALNIQGFDEQLVFAGSRFVIAGLLLLPLCRGDFVANIRKAPKFPLLAILLGQTYFQYLFFYYGLSMSSGALGALLVGSGSFWWMLLAPLILKTPAPTGRHWLLLAGCTAGIVCAVYDPSHEINDTGFGAIAFLLATFSGAVAAIFMKRVAPISGSLAPTCFSLGGGGLLLLLTVIPSWPVYWSHFNIYTLWVTLYLALVSAAAFSIWNRLIRRYSVNTLSGFRFLIPLMGVIESVVFIPGEHLRPGILIGGAIVLGCLIGVARIKEGPLEGRSIRP